LILLNYYSKVQARFAFATYLTCIQQRLTEESSSKSEPDVDGANEQMVRNILFGTLLYATLLWISVLNGYDLMFMNVHCFIQFYIFYFQYQGSANSFSFYCLIRQFLDTKIDFKLLIINYIVH